ncbi:hypothetical protein METUNv1_02481 [Methyloversatilis universalis FAM5]|uniref:Uncharacterized protein n=1 Tax=Methyloversatilis universalis (strain ATCC BAA-1314 / DSM 25237 / JCM 13912 / CCUG 52030 / FAM5) TaxID=1000565 RepID=F5RDW5_METUF|nr:hypothetical protein METUNv1_02481 [Methyloversatilis universalis FAM5]
MGHARPRQVGLDRRFHLLCRCGAAAGALQHESRHGGQALLPGAAQPGRRGTGRRSGVGGDRQRLYRARHALGRLRDHAVRWPHHGEQREVLERQGHQPAPQRALHRHFRFRARFRRGVAESAGGAVQPVRRLWPVRLRDVGDPPRQPQPDAADLAAAGSGRLIANAGRRCTVPADVLYSRAGAAPPRARPNACMTRVVPQCDALRRSP